MTCVTTPGHFNKVFESAANQKINLRSSCASRSPFLDRMCCHKTVLLFLQHKPGLFQPNLTFVYPPVFLSDSLLSCRLHSPSSTPTLWSGEHTRARSYCGTTEATRGRLCRGLPCRRRRIRCGASRQALLPIPAKQEFKRSPPSSQHPVYCVSVVGTQNANNLISISTDGKMCSWSLDMLSQPQVINK